MLHLAHTFRTTTKNNHKSGFEINNYFCFVCVCVILKGYGTYYYKEGGVEYYEGEWYAGKRSGWGRMYYANGDIYEGKIFI